MAYIKLESENPNFSFVLSKNPATQEAANEPFTKSVSSGKTFLWFENPQKVFLLFKGNKNPKSSGFEYLDYESYSSGKCYLTLIDQQLRTASNKDQEEIDTHPAKLEFSLYNHTGFDYLKCFPGLVTSCVTTNQHSIIQIEGKTVKETLNVCQVISLVSILHDPDYYFEHSQFLKYFEMILGLTQNYRILRTMVSFVKNKEQFKDIKDLLNESECIYNFTPYRSQEARRNWYTNTVKHLNSSDLSSTIVDLGCGEGDYFKAHSRLYETVIAVEQDVETANDAYHMSRKIQQTDKISVHTSTIQAFLDSTNTLENSDVLITEVLEHIDQTESENILNKILSLNPKNLFITLPNKDFNEYLEIENGKFRHDDHYWEPTQSDFLEIVNKLQTTYSNYEVKESFIGDSLYEEPTNSVTFAIHLLRKG